MKGPEHHSLPPSQGGGRSLPRQDVAEARLPGTKCSPRCWDADAVHGDQGLSAPMLPPELLLLAFNSTPCSHVSAIEPCLLYHAGAPRPPVADPRQAGRHGAENAPSLCAQCSSGQEFSPCHPAVPEGKGATTTVRPGCTGVEAALEIHVLCVWDMPPAPTGAVLGGMGHKSLFSRAGEGWCP